VQSLSAELFDEPIEHGKKNIMYNIVRLETNYQAGNTLALFYRATFLTRRNFIARFFKVH
jgi:hypothetical protein